MLKKLYLKNYRGFSEHNIPFSDLAILVGKNNAGKSTLIEALRIVSLCLDKIKTSPLHFAPSWTGFHRKYRGVKPSTKNIGIDFLAIGHGYSDENSYIHAEMHTGHKLIVALNSMGSIFAYLVDQDNENISEASVIKDSLLPKISILPQIKPVLKDEKLLNQDYVRARTDSYLSSRHFRNQIYYRKEIFDQFKENVENSWPSVSPHAIRLDRESDGTYLSLQIRNEDFVGELYLMGHGLQMWLQTMWFITREKEASTIILDEPDVYMHADLQRLLVRYLKSKFAQVIIATHSSEIMSEVNPDNTIVIDKKSERSKIATDILAIQAIINGMGSFHNIQASRIWSSKKIIIIEGKDIKILKKFQDIIYPYSSLPLDIVPNFSANGWGGWQFALGVSSAMQNSFGEKMKVFCIFDSDYHTSYEIGNRYSQAHRNNIDLKIWDRKEIENYLIDADVISRVLTKKSKTAVSIEAVKLEINNIISNLEDEVIDSYASELQKTNKGMELKTARSKAKEAYKDKVKTCGRKDCAVSGKMLLKRLSEWGNRKYQTPLTTASILMEMRVDEVPEEVRNLITSIEHIH